MLRVIIRSVNYAASANVGGPIEETHHTIDIEAPTVEAFLAEPERMNDHYTNRHIVGVEVRTNQTEKGETP